ncbi:MAG: DUF2975 domain-containing protein [Pseudomonadota bacterium]
MPSSHKPRDPLLSMARAVVGLLTGLFILVGVIVTIGLGAILTVQRGAIMERVATANGGHAGYPLILLAFVLIIALMAASFLFMRELGRLIGSVEQGDPFQPFNADRLRRMGWLTVGSQLVLVALAAIGMAFDGIRPALMAEDALNAAFGGLLLALVLFILARVFRIGTAMREELEGTV